MQSFKQAIRRVISIAAAKLQLSLITLLLFTLPVNAGPHLVLTPKISIAETEFNFGDANEGIELRHTFRIENRGRKDLVIKTAFSTCGCTVPHIKKKRIAPGESTDMEVVMDTSMKQGDVTKPIEIRSNDPIEPIKTIYIKAKIRSPHADLGNGTERTAKIFTGRCAACHVNQGKGKVGEDLFFSDCGMCHGYSARGVPGVAPALVPFDYHNKEFADTIKTVISKGSLTHRSMPGYAKEFGGPLTEEEIDSIVDYLRLKSDRENKNSGGG